MRIIIDLQGAQSTGSRNRGVGRYSLSLAQAIGRNCGKHEIIIALNGLFPETIEPIRAAFDGILPQEQIRVWQTSGPVNQLSPDNTWRRQTAELVREAFLTSLNPDMVLVSSLFEGLSDDAVSSIGTLSSLIPTAVVLYDLIPFINHKSYLENPVIAEWYEGKIAHLRRANLLLSISESSRQEGIKFLGFPPEKITNISTAADAQFCQKSLTDTQQQELMQRYGLSGHYVMYTGGIDHRKNIDGLVRAYASLPVSLRKQHQLAVVCSIQDADRARLESLARKVGLVKDELVLTGFVPEEDLISLYNLCKAFIFPSKHEGFGLPALEAMCCGRAVIGANTSSLPEVIGNDEALFDPHDDAAIAAKLEQVLVDDNFRQTLEKQALIQIKKFSWDKSAQRAIAALEAFSADTIKTKSLTCTAAQRPRLAYISPLPPERSGISDYSAELLPELARHYDIDVVVAQEAVSDRWVKANCQIRTIEWFRAHADAYDRVLYHFGNSAFHQHMFELLEQIPGVIVLHDFFLSGIAAHMDVHGFKPGYWASELYNSHGYPAVQHRFTAEDTADVVWKYPCNFSVLQNAQGVIVHSENSRRLAQYWYGSSADNKWIQIPLLRVPDIKSDKSKARTSLNLSDKDFVVCSFGLLGPTKLNHRLLDAWLNSALAIDKSCHLVFVGENAGGEYGQGLLQKIRKSGVMKRIHITGWADTEVFRQYLAAADIGVQLRTKSRGETSAGVLDCMNYGLPTIVNANGSMADLPEDGCCKLADNFCDEDLITALERLWQDASQRQQLGERAQHIIRTEHAPRSCAGQYFNAVERFYRDAATAPSALVKSIAQLDAPPCDAELYKRLAQAIDQSIAPKLSQRQLFVDISELVHRDAKTGVQHVVRSILREWLVTPPNGFRIEPVYATTAQQGYRYARHFTLEFLNCPSNALIDAPISFRVGDIFLGLTLQTEVVPVQRPFYQAMRQQGVNVQFVVYDLLLMQRPDCFQQGATLLDWLEVVAEADGAICVSKFVAHELGCWLGSQETKRERPLRIDWFHLGSDVGNVSASNGMPDDASTVLKEIYKRPSFLMVGTIEPRKGHAQVLAAFEEMWAEEVCVNLVIVGKQGWMVEELVKKLRDHPERGTRLFWLTGISDEYLEKVYATSSCLIAASEGEGFELPLIEAAQHKLPIIARDIPVFREVAGEHAFYFDGKEPEELAETIQNWLKLYKSNQHPSSESMPWLTWKESAAQLLERLGVTTLETNKELKTP
ncbi:MAG: glycosyl transferase family 1 [Porticoccaceae bacterium]|nr:MAG: glycosyl transferase family 1 [Porticoccaceae bacterium]